MPAYSITLQRGGASVFSATIPAHRAFWVGDWRDGVAYQPDPLEVVAALPRRYRAAATRRLLRWQASVSSRKVPLRCVLLNARGDEMAMLYVTPDWPAR